MRQLRPVLTIIATGALATSAAAFAPGAARRDRPPAGAEPVRCVIQKYVCGELCLRYAGRTCIIREPKWCTRRVCR